MPEYLHESWRSEERHKIRIAFLHVLTNQEPNTLRHQVEVVQREIERWMEAKGITDVDLVFASEQASIADERKYNHPAGDLYRMWMRTMCLSDIIVVHAHENGSAALGMFIAAAANAAHRPSVVVLVPQGTKVSKAWRGQEDHHDNVKFVDLYDEGHALTMTLQFCVEAVLKARLGYIEDGPARRGDVEAAMDLTVRRLRRYWNASTPEHRRTVARKLSMSEQLLDDHIQDPSLLANLGYFKVLAAQQLIVPDRGDVMSTGRERLSVKTMEAWRVWADHQDIDDDFAIWQLRRAIEAQSWADAGVAKPLDLTEPSLWDTFALEDEER
jgi:hypothetical protein